MKKIKLEEKKAKEKVKKSKYIQNENIVRYTPDIAFGLTNEQVEERTLNNLTNNVKQNTGQTYLQIFAKNIFTYFNIIFFIVAMALLYVGAFGDLIFLLIIVANISIGIIQEIKAKRMIAKLTVMSQNEVRVMRNGKETKIALSEIALDEIVILTTGNQVPSDCIIKEGEIDVNESMLTGESMPVHKQIGDLLFAGSFISSGTCYCQIERIKDDNYVEKLTHKAKRYRTPNSEILKTLSNIIKGISIAIIPISILMFINNVNIGLPMNEVVRKTAGSIVGMIPAGMFLLTSMALFIGVIRLGKQNTLVQNLYCIEMLARVNVLCLDKTGTITDGQLKVDEFITLKDDRKNLRDVMGSMLFALNDNNFTSIALTDYFKINSLYHASVKVPFSSTKKMSAVTFDDIGTYVLGAPEFVLKSMGVRLEKMINGYAMQGLRVLVLANSDKKIVDQKVPANLTPIALIVLSDNIREETKETIEWFNQNDVKIKVISGDNPLTVSEVAKRAGVLNADKWISLEGLNKREVYEVANYYTVFGRVTPEQKAILVKSIRANGDNVAMTGDGVNDILALREADCSIAMASGSEAARNVSHLVLMDSKFSSMPKVVAEGRKVVNNVQKSSSLYLMKTVFTIMLSLILILLGQDYPFSPRQLMLLEFFVIGVPSFVLALEPSIERIKGNFLSQTFSRAIPSGIIMMLVVMSMIVYSNLNGIPTNIRDTMCIIAVTYCGFLLMCNLCMPLNWIRGTLIAISGIMITIAFFIIGKSLMGIVNMEMQENYFTLMVVFMSYPVSSVLTSFVTNMTSSIKPNNTAKMEKYRKELELEIQREIDFESQD